MRARPIVSSCVRVVALVLLLAASARAGGVRIVDQPALGSFATIQSAVDAASENDVLLVGEGSYSGFAIDGKSLSVFALTNGSVEIAGTIEVRNLVAVQTVLLVGLRATGATLPLESAPALLLESNFGRVRVQDCAFVGGSGDDAFAPPASHQQGAGGDAAQVESSARVACSGSTFRGGAGGGTAVAQSDSESEGGAGGDGIDAASSTVALYSCELSGGAGGDGGDAGGDGGSAYRAADFGLVAVGSTFEGEDGGDAWDAFASGPAGSGGHGLVLDPGSQGQIVDCAFAGGAAGTCSVGALGCAGQPGQGRFGAGVFHDHAGEASTLSATSVLADDRRWTISGSGVAGDRVLLQRSLVPSFQIPSPVNGIWLVPMQVKLQWNVPVVQVDPAGSFSFDLFPPQVARATNVRQLLYAQGLFRSDSGAKLLGEPLHLLSLARDALPDCDGDLVSDYVAILEGLAPDCDHDLVPDACEIASGASMDLNHNGVPDECDAHRTRYVDDSAATGGDGSSALPFQSLRQAFNASITGDTIEVRDGVYAGPDNRDLSFAGRDLVVRSANGPDNCTIDCQQLGRAFILSDVHGEIEGFTISRGDAGLPQLGGAIRCSYSTLTLRDCTIADSFSGGEGGALHCGGHPASGATRVEHCRFLRNSAGASGGAIAVDSTDLIVVDCTFAENTAQRGGAAHSDTESQAWFQHCSFRANSATVGGGAVFQAASPTSEATVRLDDCLLVGNSAPRGGAIRAAGANVAPFVRVVLTSSDLVANVASTSGGAIDASASSAIELANCIVWGNSSPIGAQIHLQNDASSLSFVYGDAQGGLAAVSRAAGSQITWGPGTIDLDPSFVDPDGPDNNPLTLGDNDYRLLAGSPCVDAGDVARVVLDLFDLDLDGNTSERVPLDLDFRARFFDDAGVLDTGNGRAPIVDMGAYERRP